MPEMQQICVQFLVWKDPGERNGNTLPVLLPGESFNILACTEKPGSHSL